MSIPEQLSFLRETDVGKVKVGVLEKDTTWFTVYFWAAVSSRLTVPPVLYGLRFLYRLRFLTVTGSLWSTVSARFRGSYFPLSFFSLRSSLVITVLGV